jgi:hypothetical protein
MPTIAARFHALAWRLLAGLAVMVAATPVLAGDRPFIFTSSAAAEEDDDAVWSVESVFQRAGPLRGLNVAAEYAFNPTNSMQIEFARLRDRAVGESASAAGLEYKHLFNHIAREGYGYGMVVSIELGRPQGSGWEAAAWGATLPLSIQLGADGGLLHLNAGLVKPSHMPRQWTASAAVEQEVAKRTVLFGEVARLGEGGLLHGGVRYWAQRERFAVDLSLQRIRADGLNNPGFVIGLGWYDL